MKQIFILSLLSILIFTSCINVRFAQIQPKGVKPLGKFPEKIQGTYIHKDSESKMADTVIVKPDCYLFQNDNSQSIPVAALDTIENIDLTEKYVVVKENGELFKYNYEIVNDTLNYLEHKFDKLELSDELVLTYYKKMYFLNSKAGKNWTLSLIEILDKNTIQYKIFTIPRDSKEKLKKFKKISRYKVIEDEKNGDKYYLFNPTKRQLIKLIKAGLPTEGTVLNKVK